MRIEHREVANVVVIDLFGNIRTNEDYAAFKKAIDDVIEQGKTRVVLNFREVHFINSSGLGRLVLAAKRAKENSGGLSIINLSNDLKELFSFTRLDSKIPIFITEEEAVRSFLVP